MDVHKPKPWHGWREFLKEYLIIVIGVLTALGAEQLVEVLQWRLQIQTVETRLLPEIRNDLLESYDRILLRRCMANRIALLRDALLKPGAAWAGAPIKMSANLPPGASLSDLTNVVLAESPMPFVYLAPVHAWREGVWTSTSTSGVMLHMQPNRAAGYATQYRFYEAMRATQASEIQAYAKLSPLAFPLTLSPSERAQYLEVLGELSLANASMAATAVQSIVGADRAGLRIKSSIAADHIRDIRDTTGYAGCIDPVRIPLAPG